MPIQSMETSFSSTSTKCTRVIARFTLTLRCSKMAASVQMFPSILISKNAHPSNCYSKRSTSYVQETSQTLSATIKQFQKNYPMLISMYKSPSQNSFFQYKHLLSSLNFRCFAFIGVNKKFYMYFEI